MIFYFLITIVFIAEIIIATAIILTLVKFDKQIKLYNDILNEVKPSIKSVVELVRKISEQFLELAPTVEKNIKAFVSDMVIGQLKSLLGGLTFWLVKREVEKHV